MLQFLSPAEDLIRRFNPFAPTARRAEDPRPEVHVYHMLGLRNGQIVHRPPHQANPAGPLGGLHTFQPRTVNLSSICFFRNYPLTPMSLAVSGVEDVEREVSVLSCSLVYWKALA